MRIDRSKIPMVAPPGMLEEAPFPAAARAPLAPTYVEPAPVGRRVALAIAAGLLVVVGLYVVVRLAWRHDPSGPVTQVGAPVASASAPPNIPLPPPSPTPLATVDISALPVASAPPAASAASGATGMAPATGASGRAPRPPRPTGSAGGGDIGEFKPTFNH